MPQETHTLMNALFTNSEKSLSLKQRDLLSIEEHCVLGHAVLENENISNP